MSLQQDIEFLNSCNKEQFVAFAQQVNIFRTMQEPNYLTIKEHIISLLPKHNLTKNDVMPLPRRFAGDLITTKIK